MTRCLSIFLLLAAAVLAGEPMAGYLMGYFTETPKGTGNSFALHLATSEDGLDWMPLNQNKPVLVPTLGTRSLRDPFFLRKQDGGFVVLATDPAGQDNVSRQAIHVWDTADFFSFTNPRLLKLHDTLMSTLAPEATFDPDRKQYAVIWTGGVGTNRIHVNYTSDFTRVSGEEAYFDPGYDVRDATVFPEPEHGGYFLYYKDSVANRLRGIRSPALTPRGFDGGTALNPPGEFITGAPLILKSLRENRWFLYGESNGLCAWQCTDIAKGDWQEINRRDYNPPPNAKHATAIPISRSELDRIVGRWGRPIGNRLKPWNFPGYFVRHEESICKISAWPFDPWQDSQWRIVPGLADAKAVSFESINLPGHYLRTVAEHVVIAIDDGSKLFKNRATFVKEPGLADRSWSSFRSRSSPDLYLRHANFYLRLEPAKSTADKEDSTFRIVF
ncbi:MAG: AbfB domain-containing protein [Luteolibacter sp.]